MLTAQQVKIGDVIERTDNKFSLKLKIGSLWRVKSFLSNEKSFVGVCLETGEKQNLRFCCFSFPKPINFSMF